MSVQFCFLCLYYVFVYMCYKYYGPQSMHGNHPDVEKVHFPNTRWSSHMHHFCHMLCNSYLCYTTESRKHMIRYMFTASSIQKVTQELASLDLARLNLNGY